MSNVQPAAPATRNRRSDRHAPAKQVTPLPPAPNKKPAAKPGAGKFPVRTCIVLGMVLIPLLRRGADLFDAERMLARYGEVLPPAVLLLFGVLLLLGAG